MRVRSIPVTLPNATVNTTVSATSINPSFTQTWKKPRDIHEKRQNKGGGAGHNHPKKHHGKSTHFPLNPLGKSLQMYCAHRGKTSPSNGKSTPWNRSPSKNSTWIFLTKILLRNSKKTWWKRAHSLRHVAAKLCGIKANLIGEVHNSYPTFPTTLGEGAMSVPGIPLKKSKRHALHPLP